MSSESSSDEYATQGVKKAAPEKWKRNIQKKARTAGTSYVDGKGRVVPERKLGDDCNCRSKCFTKVGNPENIMKTFYSMESKDIQDTYLQGLIECAAPTRKKKCFSNSLPVDQSSTSEDEQSKEHTTEASKKSKPKNHTFKFFVKEDFQKIQVCKKAFVAMHGISAKRVQRLSFLLTQGKSPIDMRGKKSSANAISGPICLKINEFVNSLEFKETHYAGKVKKYIADARLNIKILYNLFLKENPCKVSYDFFRKYYKENLGYRFGRPQVDVCMTCEELNAKLKNPILNDTAKRVASAELLIHKRRAKKFYGKMKQLKSELQDKDSDLNEKTLVICFDYMANLPLPNIPVQEVYYLRQLWVYTFCIHELNTNKATFYVYHEGVAHKSPNEVCSWLLDYLSKADKKYENLIIFSDGAAGQNKNNCLLRVLMNLTGRNVFKSIKYYFPIRGHSFLPCDRDFGRIKRVLKKCDRIYSVDEYKELMLQASPKGKFVINSPTTDMVIDFQNWWPKFYKRTCLSDDSYGRHVSKQDKLSFQISKYNQFTFSSSEKGKSLYRHYF